MKNIIFALVLLLPMFASAKNILSKQIYTSQSMGATSQSIGVGLRNLDNFAIQAVWTGTAENGTFKLQGSNDDVTEASSVTNWTDISGSSQTISADGDFLWTVALSGYRYIRLVYTRASGTGTMNAVFYGKGVE